MATRFEVALPLGTPRAFEAAEAALDLIDAVEEQLTVYRETSEISRINARAHGEALPVEPRLFELLRLAQMIHRDTGGAFDIAAGALTAAWGFRDRQPAVPSPAALAAAQQVSGFRHVLLDNVTQSIRLLKPGLVLNLGGIGKGYALDRAAELLRREWNIRSALLHGGGSSILGLGTPPGSDCGWPVALRHPTNDGRTLGTVFLRDRALGTSAATYQHYLHNGRKLGHVLDPRTGWPATCLSATNITAATATEADAYSTATFILGPAAPAFLQSRPEFGAVFLEDNAAAPVIINMPGGDYAAPTLLERTLNDMFLPD
jgi:thiamine biosynthesis lipoprotein